MTAFTSIPLSIGNAGINEPILTGVLIFGVVAIALGYLSFISREFEAGFVMKIGTVVLFVLAVLSYYWPSRPWPH